MQPTEVIEESWDKKKIIITTVVLLAVGFGVLEAKKYFLDQNQTMPPATSVSNASKAVAGVSTADEEDETPQSLPIQSFSPQTVQADVQKKINTITQEVTKLSVTEIASSSPQIQKIMEDLKALEQYPRNQVKDTCVKMCSNL